MSKIGFVYAGQGSQVVGMGKSFYDNYQIAKDVFDNIDLDIDVMMENVKTKSRLQLSEIRCVDMQRLDLRKPFCNVLSTRKEIINYVEEHLLK